jgi:hypothetical protein
MSIDENKLLESYTNDPIYQNMSRAEKEKLYSKVDNFLEALFIEPTIFSNEVFHVLKLREKKLKKWLNMGQVSGALFFSSFYLIKILNRGQGFYFKDFWSIVFFTGLFAFAGGRTSEKIGNRLYYEGVLYKLANKYNITDEEIEDLQLKKNEQFLLINKKNQEKKSSLDSIKFKI